MGPVREPVRQITSHVPRAAIAAEIRLAQFPGHDPARWALPLVEAAEEHGTAWSLVELDADEFGALWLPAHAGEPCHGDRLTLGVADGGTVAAQAAWLDSNAAAYAAANPSCWSRLERARADAAAPVVVSPSSVGDRRKPDHAALVVVDGYHRTLAYWRAGHRTLRAYVRTEA